MNRRFVVSLPLTRYRLRYRSQKSSALVLVLGCLVFLCVLVVAFFASVSVERQSAQFYANSSSVKLLGDSAVDIVMGQIKDATKGTDSAGKTLAWASQPGMIRNYNTQAEAVAFYKLYSWNGMVTNSFNPTSSSELPADTWATSPALYTDLNDPVSDVFPIVDPSATNSVIGFSIDKDAAHPTTRNAAPMPVQWLYVLKDGALAAASGSAGSTATVSAATKDNPIVGRIAFWTDDDTSKININTAAGDAWTNSPSGQPTNAAGFWDTPRLFSSSETNLAWAQPVKGEFQRYPGHPATTYLSAVFPNMTTNNLFALVPRVNGGGSNGGSLVVTNTSPITQKMDRLYASVDEMMFSTNMNSATNRVGNDLGATTISNKQVHTANFFLTAHSRAPEVNLYNEPRIVTWPVNETNTAAYRTAYDRLLAFCGSLVGKNAVSGSTATNAYYFQRASSVDPTYDLPKTATASGVGRNRTLITYLHNLTSQPVPGFSTNGETFQSKYPGAGGYTDGDQILTEIFDYIRALNSQDASSPTMTNTFTPTSALTYGSDNINQMQVQQGQITPIYDTETHTRGLGRFPTVTEVGFLFSGIAQTLSPQTNYPPSYTTNGPPAYNAPSANYSTTSPVGTATNCGTGYTRVQGAIVVNMFDPSMGFGSRMGSYFIEYSGLSNFKWADGSAMFRQDTVSNYVGRSWNLYGGYIGMKEATDTGNGYGVEMHNNADTYGNQAGLGYPAYSIPYDIKTVTTALQNFYFQQGTLTINIRSAIVTNLSAPLPAKGPILQTFVITFPAFRAPTPKLAPLIADYGLPPYTNIVVTDYRNIATRFGRAGPGTWITDRDVYRGMVLDAAVADARTVAGMTNIPSNYFTRGPNYPSTVSYITNAIAGHGLIESARTPLLGAYYGLLVPNVTYSTNTALTNVATYTAPDNVGMAGSKVNGLTYTTLTNYAQPAVPTNFILGQPYAATSSGTNNLNTSAAIPVVFNASPSGAVSANGVFAGGGTSSSAPPGDWDTGLGAQPDGPYINKADEGDVEATNSGGLYYPYFTQPVKVSYLVSQNFFTPNRQMPSPAMFGSLPTGVLAQRPWQTLLFKPDPTGTKTHMGAKSPQDHLFLDLFNMPVVEPYPISEPFSTAGKINMNYQIVPFTYITRSTAVQAVLRSEQMLAIPTGDGILYKVNPTLAKNRRYFIDLPATLGAFTTRFSSGDIFRSASEICNIWLVPLTTPGQTYSGMQAFWTTPGTSSGTLTGALTGDNIRERPYANIYPRLTTKSNTFTVHYRVETLKKTPNTAYNEWVEGTDVVTGSLRGSTTLERYLDTSDTRIPDYAGLSQPLAAGQAIDNFYKFRVLETKQFTP